MEKTTIRYVELQGSGGVSCLFYFSMEALIALRLDYLKQ